MRVALFLAAALDLLATLWCQALETRAELRGFIDRPVSADVPEVHSSRVLQQGRNDGIAALLTGASTVFLLAALALSGRRRSHEHTKA
jgi:hypothetical protein